MSTRFQRTKREAAQVVFRSVLSPTRTSRRFFVFDIFSDAHENEKAIMFADYVVNIYRIFTFLRRIHVPNIFFFKSRDEL